MADNAPPAASGTSAGGHEARGTKRAHSPDRNGSNKRGRGGHGRGRGSDRHGGRGKGDGQKRRDKKGFASKNPNKHQKADMGRGQWSRSGIDRKRDDQKNGKNPWEGSEHATQFSKEEIDAEGRKPKRKVAVLIGYAGTGYKGMQINATEKTIEGDLFKAFVAAGAISKANADDPKKSSLVRCARTDKGVHAAGNVISLKLIVEDPDIVKKINENLPPQIRVWGMERTNAAFSCYQTCDSRWYEYLIPTFSFAPPHPKSYMGKKLAEYAEKEGALEEWKSRQADVADFWEKADEKYIKPILDEFDEDMQRDIMAAIHATSELPLDEIPKKKKGKAAKAQKDAGALKKEEAEAEAEAEAINNSEPKNELGKEEGANIIEKGNDSNHHIKTEEELALETNGVPEASTVAEDLDPKASHSGLTKEDTAPITAEDTSSTISSKPDPTPLETAIRRVKTAYIAAKKSYRITPARKSLVQAALNQYIGTHNFHNYTIQKLFSDPSAKRVIRSFTITPPPTPTSTPTSTSPELLAHDTEYLSLKIHGQSFMMHQIRKMVALATLLVRCGADAEKTIPATFGSTPISIPKAPALGLLLERPVFESYNEQAEKKFGRQKLDFDKWRGEMEGFKQREIYERMFREEERDHLFQAFFHHVDHYRTDHFLWMTAGGLAAARQSQSRKEFLDRYGDGDGDGDGDDESDREMPDADGQEG